MALASSHTKVFTRSQGHSATAAAAYRSGEKVYDEQTGKTHDYTRRKGIAYAEIFAPTNAPDWVYDRQTLWNTVERQEKRKDSQLAREVEIALQHELTLAQNIALAREYAHTFTKQGMIADVAIHYKIGEDGNFHNPHAHLMLTMRELDGDHFSSKKCQAWNDWTNVEAWRKEYEMLTNSYLERAGSKERICVDSYEKQGIDQVPTVHLGHHAHQLEQAEIASERGDLNRAIEEKNRQLAVCDQALAKVDTLIQKEQEQLANEKRVDNMYRTAAEAKGLKYRSLEPHEIDTHNRQHREQQQARTPTPEEYRANIERVDEMYRRVEETRRQQKQGRKKEEEPPHHKPDTKPRRMSLEELDRMYKEQGQEYNERRKRERERERDSPDSPPM